MDPGGARRGPVSLHADETVMPYADYIYAIEQIQPGHTAPDNWAVTESAATS